MTVLVVTWSGDSPTVAAVCAQLEARGEHAFRFDTDLYPSTTRISFELDAHSTRIRFVSTGGEVDARDVRAVWSRRARIGERLSPDLTPSMRRACIGESRAVLHGCLAQLDALHVDREAAVLRASHKPLQLRWAQETGFEVPRTLLTSDGAQARRFSREPMRTLVAKPLTHFRIDEDERARVVLTSRVERRDLDDDAALAVCPTMFQEEVAKALELRVIVIGDEVFAAAVDSHAHAHTAVDWRAGARELADRWFAHELPLEVAARAIELVRRFELHYGAIDMILTPDGRYVFLELNPQGEFSWLEETGPRFPISRSIAALLANGACARS
ncbi:MAG: MvdC/MvdD family ATP grasp protein [Planctomycetota bacterium]